MRCPYCGFHHLEPRERCVRCRKPLNGEPPAPEHHPEASADEVGGPGFESRRPPPRTFPHHEPAESGQSAISASDAADPGAGTDSEAVELVIEREKETEETSAEATEQNAADTAMQAPAAQMPATASRNENPPEGSASPPPQFKEEPLSSAAPDGLMTELSATSPGGDSSETTAVMEESSRSDERSGEPFKASALDLVEKALKSTEPAASSAAEAEVVAALAREITPPEQEPQDPEPGAACPVTSMTQEPQQREPELEWRPDREHRGAKIETAAGPAPAPDAAEEPEAEATNAEQELDPCALPGEETAAALRGIMEANDPKEHHGLAQAAGDEPAVHDEAEGSASAAREEKQLDRFFEVAADRPLPPQEEESSSIEIRPAAGAAMQSPAVPDLPLGELRAPLKAASGTGVRVARKKKQEKPRAPGAWLLPMRHAAAGAIDVMVWLGLGLLLFKLAAIMTGCTPLHGSAAEWAWLVVLPLVIMSGILALVYGALFGSITGRTPGMMIFGLKMSDPKGCRPRLGKAFIRTGVFLLCLIPAGSGLLIPLLGGKKGGLPERLTKIRVEPL